MIPTNQVDIHAWWLLGMVEQDREVLEETRSAQNARPSVEGTKPDRDNDGVTCYD
jgi:hypothetical protein